jgi:tetratricopeptide (TPR) repeat protein
MKALEKDRSRRYETANALARDVHRYLTDELVEARPPSTGYRLRKFVRKHRGLLATGSAFAMVVLVGAMISTWLAVRAIRAERAARQAADRAQNEVAINRATIDFLREDLLAEAAPDRNPRERQVTVEDVVRRAARKVAGRFEGQPMIEASIRRTIGQTLRALGLYSEAQEQFERAAELLRRAAGADHADTLGVRGDLGEALVAAGRDDEAEALFAEVESSARRVLGGEHIVTLVAMRGRAKRRFLTNPAEAQAVLIQVVDASRRTLGAENRVTLESMIHLAQAYQFGGKIDEAESLTRRALELSRHGLGEEHPVTLNLLHNLAMLYQERGKIGQAEPLLRAVLENDRRVLGEEHSSTWVSMSNLGMLYAAQGKLDEADVLLRRGMELACLVGGDNQPGAITLMGNLAMVYQEKGQFTEAEALLNRALQASLRLRGPEDLETLGLLEEVASLDGFLGRLAEAESLQVRAYEGFRRILGGESDRTLLSGVNLAWIQSRHGKAAEAETLARQVVQAIRAKDRPPSWFVETLSILGEAQLGTKAYAEAEATLQEDLSIREIERPDAWTRFFSQIQLGTSLLGQGKLTESEILLRSGYEGMKAREKSISPRAATRLPEALDRLIELYTAMNRPDEVKRWQAERAKYAHDGKVQSKEPKQEAK